MIKNYFLSFFFFCCAFNFGYGQSPWINEIHYDNTGGDSNEGVEVAVPTGYACAGVFELILYNGNNGRRYNDFIVVTTGGTTSNGVTFYWTPTAGLQNGTPDGIALVCNGTVIQFLSYEGSFTATNGPANGVTSTDIGVAEASSSAIGLSLQLQGSGCDYSDFSWTGSSAHSRNVINPSQTISCSTTVEFTTATSSLAEGGLSINICVGITDPSATSATTVAIALNGSSTATNGSDYDDGAGIPAAITFLQTLTFPIGSSANRCLTIFISNDDLLIEGNETVILDLTSPAGGDSAALGTNNQHILTITDNDAPAFADVVITEIMYNTSGTDDEWIEICNLSGSSQILNDYTIRVGGTIEFTFPSTGVVIADGNCITVSLGDNGGVYNIDCPFTPDYTNGSGTGTLNNSSDSISLTASDGSTQIDVVTYNSSDGGNTNSLHVSDASLDNSDTSTNFWEVINGGSPGINSLISQCTPVGPEINIEGATGFFPDIANGDITPVIFDGTDFGNSNLGTGLTNTFRIENFAGTTDLTITSVTVLSGDISDFLITVLPASPIGALGFSNFNIEFNPTLATTRTAVIQIISNDSDENPYTFTVTGEGFCVADTITALPNSGPVGTIVTVTGTNLEIATASINGLPAAVNNVSATLMEVIIPAGASTGNLEIFDSIGCPGFTSFIVINSQITSCQGSSGSTPSGLFISEVTDTTLGGLTYLELYNGTGAGINIDNYTIEVIGNGNATAAAFNIFDLENVIIANGDTYVIALARSNPIDASNYCLNTVGGSGELATSVNAQFNNGGINKKPFQHDVIRLVNSGTTIDEFGVHLDNDWMDSTIITGDRGFNFRRSNTATVLPDPTFTLAELGNWNIIDWIGSGATSCSGNDYSDIGLFDFSLGNPPLVTNISSATTACNEATISVTATEGFVGSNTLQYLWFFYNPSQAGLGWQTIANGGIYTTNMNSPELIISDAESVQNYQFYCEVREDRATCYSASDAIRITIVTAIWDGFNWNWNDGTIQDTLPNSTTTVIINGFYDTSIGGIQTSFSACYLTVTATSNLLIQNNTFIEIQNDIIADGDITVFPQGSVVQINDFASVTANGIITVQKETSILNTVYDYTYWSSPVIGETIENIFANVTPSRRYIFNAANFEDLLIETNNTDTFTLGQDDIDDNGDDWLGASGTMIPGVGYAATPNLLGPPLPIAQQFPFVGAFNNGIITPSIVNDSGGTYNDWNFIGNPYPSALDTSMFFTVNSGITNTIFLWSQATLANRNASGNEGFNFSDADYAIISASGINTAGGSGVIPTNFVPSGQGFFIEALSGTSITFNNSMRTTGSNDQLFRNTNSSQVLWLNLSSDNGVAKQIAIAHLEGATDAYDGSYYDVKENLSSRIAATLYSTILDDSDENQFVIQGRNLSSLHENEIIPLGFKTIITVPTLFTISIAQFEGNFYIDNSIYIKDNLLNTFHNLKDSDYNFTSEPGEFNDRFEIVFTTTTLSIDNHLIDVNELYITELQNGDVQFEVRKTHTITTIDIMDVTGRRIYTLKGNNSTEVYDLSNLRKAPYIAKVSLSNGQIISKKAIKQR